MGLIGRGWRVGALAALASSLGCQATALAGTGELPPADAAAAALLDPAVPALETFRGWPPPELLERFHGLPWGPLAFHRAELFGRPVFFVLTVDWSRGAQRLATETLVEPEVVRALNQDYITVLVNADRRPDIRERYQTGAWPSMALLLPDGNPMLSQANDLDEVRPISTSELAPQPLLFLLREGTVYWNKWSSELRRTGSLWAKQEGPEQPDPGLVDAAASEGVARWLLANADREEGGFGAGPKFLVPGLDEYASHREARSLPAVRRHSRLTLERLVASPLFDRRDGGLHRLAGAPSFGDVQYEKLLTVNANLVRELSISLAGEPSAKLRDALQRTAAFMMGTLARPQGGFWLAQAADPTSRDGSGYWKSRRPGKPPPVDELVLSGPNALAGAALARAGALLGERAMLDAGRAALDLVHDRAYRPGRGAIHVIAPGPDSRIYLGTQVDVALGFLDGYETTGFARYLDAARNIAEFLRLNLRDASAGLYRDHLGDPSARGLLSNERHPMRPNVQLARVLLRLDVHDPGRDQRREALAILERFSGNPAAYGVHGVEVGLAIEEALGEPLRITVGGPAADPRTLALRHAAVRAGRPWTVILSGPGEGQPFAEVARGAASARVIVPDELARALAELVAGGVR